jgi:hypothetical protein
LARSRIGRKRRSPHGADRLETYVRRRRLKCTRREPQAEQTKRRRLVMLENSVSPERPIASNARPATGAARGRPASSAAGFSRRQCCGASASSSTISFRRSRARKWRRRQSARLELPIPMKAPVFNGIIPPGDSGIMAPPCNGMIPPGRHVPSAMRFVSSVVVFGQADLELCPRARRRLSPDNSMRWAL